MPLLREKGGQWRTTQQPARMTQPYFVRNEHEDRSWKGPLVQPPQPLGEACAVRGRPLPDDAETATVGEHEGGVQGPGPVPAEAEGMRDGGDRGGEAVDDRQGVEAPEQEAAPVGGDGARAQQLVHPEVEFESQPAHAFGGEVEAPRGRDEVGRVG